MSKSKKCCNGGSEEQLFLAEVKKVGVTDPSKPQVKFDTPFYDSTLPNRFIAIPTEDSNFIIEVALASRWAIGQWIEIEGVGKYEIINVMGNTSLVLKNAASITGNPGPGSQFLGSRKLWLTEEKEASVNVNLDAVQESLKDDDFEFCSNVEESSAADNGLFFGALDVSSVCDPCGDNANKTKQVRCFRVFKNIVAKFYTIAFPLMRSISKNSYTYKVNGEEVTRPVKDVAWNPQSGDLVTRELPGANSIDAYVGGYKQYVQVPADYASKFYVLSPSKTDGAPTFRAFDFKAAHRIGTSLAAGAVNFKTQVEAALGITLPSSGEIDIGIVATATQAAPGAAVAQVDATIDSEVIASTIKYDGIGNGYRVITIDLSSPTKTLANGTFVLEVAYIPFSYYYQD